MRTLWILCLALVVLLNSCKKDDEDPKFSTAEGDWTYTTKDGKISVDFTLAKDGTTWSVKNPVIRVEGVTGKAEVEYDGIEPPSIQYIRINANDLTLTYPYPINFTNATVNPEFTEINVPDATYTWPSDKVNVLSDITITRK